MPINATGFKYEPKQLGSFTMVKVRKTSADMSKIKRQRYNWCQQRSGSLRRALSRCAPQSVPNKKSGPTDAVSICCPMGPARMHQGLLLFASTKAETRSWYAHILIGLAPA